MSYSVYRALQKLWIHRATYFILLLEVAIGVTVVLCGFLSGRAAQTRLGLYEAQNSLGSVSLQYYSKALNGTAQENPISSADYEWLKTRCGTMGRVSFLLCAHSIYQAERSGAVRDVAFLAMNTEAFASIFGMEQRQDTVYVGRQVAADLKEGVKLFEPWIRLDTSGIALDNTEYQVEALPSGTKTLVLTALEGFDLDAAQLVVLPEAQMQLLENNGNFAVPYLSIAMTEDSDCLESLADELHTRHPGYEYSIVDQRAQMLSSMEDLTQEIRLFSWVAKFALLITTVGLVGILLIYLEQRKRELAIALTQGATQWTLLFELVCEVFLLTLLGGVLGVLASAALAPGLSNSAFTVTFHWMSVPIMLAIVLMITFVSCGCVLLGAASRYPNQLLRR